MKDFNAAKAIIRRFLEENKNCHVLQVYDYIHSRGFSFTMNETAVLIQQIEGEKKTFICQFCKQTYHVSERVQHDQGTMCLFCAHEWDNADNEQLLSHYD